jgi:hypothetical protein
LPERANNSNWVLSVTATIDQSDVGNRVCSCESFTIWLARSLPLSWYFKAGVRESEGQFIFFGGSIAAKPFPIDAGMFALDKTTR